jgi:hypothetical protein
MDVGHRSSRWRLYRFFPDEGLGLRKKQAWRHMSAAHREESRPSAGPNDVRGIDLVAYQLANGPWPWSISTRASVSTSTLP